MRRGIGNRRAGVKTFLPLWISARPLDGWQIDDIIKIGEITYLVNSAIQPPREETPMQTGARRGPSLDDRMRRIALVNSLYAGQHDGIPNPQDVAREIMRLVQEVEALRTANASLVAENAALHTENVALRTAIGMPETAA
jgi:hypothetical protein